MPKWCHDNVLDAPLNYIKANTSGYYMCSGQPATYAQAVTTFGLGGKALDLSSITLLNGDIDGRKLTVPVNTITATGAGGVVCVALVSVDTLLYVNPLDELLLVEIDYDVQLPTWDIEFGDPQ